ncbi:Gfo/Idh/MocA family protein [Phaeacidiphilus oryzae]|uniref:Gfo/Idh/MocA family protein n=1 Tax=Phaeacidiphilus oryzae TaxID=348818 RepID=UPI000565DEED|nr:Gfo/Idh/MocA family oxidoreductase [Phaeacidiphilus oryzae]
MQQSAPLGVAVIGTGRMGGDHVRRIERAISGARVAAVADIDEDRVKALAAGIDGCAAYTDPEAALADPAVDALLVASSGPAHEAVLLAALERGMPVLCEKPMTPESSAALRVVEAEVRAAERFGRRLIQVGFMRRYDRDYQSLKRRLDEGRYGRPLMLHHQHRNPSSPPFFTSAMTIQDSVVHEIDVTRWLLDEEITGVRVLRTSPSSARAPEGLTDPQLVLFETAGGRLVDTEIFVNCGFGYQVRCEAVCESGTARIGDDRGVVANLPAGGGGAGFHGVDVVPGFEERFEEAYDREVQAWVDAVRRGEAVGPSAWDGYAAQAVCEAGVRAQGLGGDRAAVELAERPGLYA